MPASRRPSRAQIRGLTPGASRYATSCQLCQRPIQASHRHVIDCERCAIWCTCSACYDLSHRAKAQ